ncbi:tRNA A64-2'-O-ribosylphosphate transferase [Apodospora peruviana]|uniref:tRNA A64-2'-O-ribosylphosphate transferase n=1 Tax=Apodospora peruviana TaxID=516989 RepID=A0AAE0II57_9PEZI|nr:tRNA A64-2'-O-ribosylphosphate transferase [Apodospora peruviana]
MPPPAISLADLIFPEQANHNFSKILGDLKRSNLSITNRLRSVRHDAAFVDEVADTFGLPLVANERCGSWYIAPSRKAGSAYFKSTDGHTGQWKFSTRRLNLHLLKLIGQHEGCIIVDSTRRGKRMPDALSKTVPVWCCVLNRALFPDNTSSHELVVPPNVVSDSEKSQMEARLPEFLASLLALDMDLASLQRQLKQKPLRPLWVTPEDNHELLLVVGDQITVSFHPIVCCTSSRQVIGTEMSEAGYIQGAGDDTENWALGLTAPIFWQHADRLLSTAESDLPALIRSLLDSPDTREASISSELKQVVAPHLFVGALSPSASGGLLASSSSSSSSSSCVVALVPKSTDPTTWVKSKTLMEVGIGKSNKTASRMLRDALPRTCEFVSRFLAAGSGEQPSEKKVVIFCDTGRDLSVGVALALYCWCFDAAGNIQQCNIDDREPFTKNMIRIKLGHIMTAQPDVNPSRATLQSVNSFLMDWRK